MTILEKNVIALAPTFIDGCLCNFTQVLGLIISRAIQFLGSLAQGPGHCSYFFF